MHLCIGIPIPWTPTIKKHDNEQSKCCGSCHDLYLDWGQIDELIIMWGCTYRLEWAKFWLVVEDVKPRVLVQAEIWLITSQKSLHKKEIYFAVTSNDDTDNRHNYDHDLDDNLDDHDLAW